MGTRAGELGTQAGLHLPLWHACKIIKITYTGHRVSLYKLQRVGIDSNFIRRALVYPCMGHVLEH